MVTAQQLPGGDRARGEVTVRPWRTDDAEALNAAIATSRGHLAPWMPWAAQPPPTVSERREQISRWLRDWSDGGDGIYGIFVREAVAGGCGLHRRIGPDGLEIGYWLASNFTGRGVMTTAAALLTDTAFTVPGIERVEIHHDRANVRSAGVPRRLAFILVGEREREPVAPAEIGIECQWRMSRTRWMAAGGAHLTRGGAVGERDEATGPRRRGEAHRVLRHDQ